MVGDYIMTKAYLRSLNELIIQSTLDASDDDISLLIDSPSGISSEKIKNICDRISAKVKKYRDDRLIKQRQDFFAWQRQQKDFVEKAASKINIGDMLKDIVAVMTQPEKVPEGLLLAFREQSGKISDEGIIETWKNLVALGLIDPDDTED